jgi:hypothetical protein
MAEVLFINENYIKKYTTINGAVDPNLLYPAIYLSQDRWVGPFLGDDLLNKLKSDVANNTVAGNYLILLEDYVQKAVLWWTMVEVLPNLTYKIDNGSLVQRISEDVQVIGNNTMSDFIDRAKANAEYYTTRLVEYLCANSHLFVEYSSNVYPERSPRTDVMNLQNYIFTSGNTATSFRPQTYTNLLRKLPL